ncbi:MAG TPA: Na/Pi symporter [Bacillales bacterium]|nr:Na/Pi symporter [Bacillales bacterium]
MNQWLSLFAVLISVFLFGMTVMRIGLQSISEKHMRTALLKMTNTPWKSFLVGVAATAVVQSSSAVMVLTVGLLAAGMIRYKQTIGIVLGTNIGTTFTLELFTFHVTDAVIPLLICGAALLFSRRQRLFSTGCVLFGLGAVFTAMSSLGELAGPLAQLKTIHRLLIMTNHDVITSAAVGAFFTAIIQSSTAATGIAMTFINEGQLTLNAGIAFMLGANIGTCVTAWIAAIRANKAAKLAAYTHIAINAAGVVVFLPFVPLLGTWAAWFTSVPGTQLAHASVLFNSVCSLAILPFAGPLASRLESFNTRR